MGRDTAVSRPGETFADRYGPWAVVAGASEGVGAAFTESLAQQGLNVMLLARRRPVLEALGADIAERTGVQTRTLAVDLSADAAAKEVIEATADLTVGLVVYCAGSDTVFEPFLSSPVAVAEAMVQRNCLTLVRLSHHFAPAMVQRSRGGIVVVGAAAGFAGAARMAAYGATKAFDMVFAEALWAELHDRGVDVLGLILGKTDTPALRRLEHERGVLASEDDAPEGADDPAEVVTQALVNLSNGPTLMAGTQTGAIYQSVGSMTRNESVTMINEVIVSAMGS